MPDRQKSPRQVIRDFAASEGICTRCTCQWALSSGTLCARCFNYVKNAPRSLANVIMRENDI